MLSANIEIFSSQTVLSSAVVNSSPIKGVNLFSMSAQIIASGGSVAGVLKAQCSNDNPVKGAAPTHWNDIASQTVSVSAAGNFIIPKFDVCYEWIRFVYTASGDGVISSRVKTIGM